MRLDDVPPWNILREPKSLGPSITPQHRNLLLNHTSLALSSSWIKIAVNRLKQKHISDRLRCLLYRSKEFRKKYTLPLV